MMYECMESRFHHTLFLVITSRPGEKQIAEEQGLFIRKSNAICIRRRGAEKNVQYVSPGCIAVWGSRVGDRKVNNTEEEKKSLGKSQ